MNNKHTPHRPPRIIKHPLPPIQKIRLDPRIRISLFYPSQQVRYQVGGVEGVVFFLGWGGGEGGEG